jgi:acyl-CoA thioester hydrolase
MGEVFTHRLRVRYSECDQQGVVFNGHYLFYYDVALTELWRALVGDYGQMVGDGYDLVVAEARIRYWEGARFDELLEVSMPVAHLGTTSMIVRPVFRVGERLIADGEVRHVFIDPASKGKREMPEMVRSALTPYLDGTGRPPGTPGA